MSFWDKAGKIDALRRLWAEGLTASQVGSKLGCSRNAVLSKVHRLGLSNGRSPANTRNNLSRAQRRTTSANAARKSWGYGGKPAAKPKPQVSPFAALGPAPVDIDPLADADIPLAQRKTLQELESEHCRWPIGDPLTPDFHFCGSTKVIGLSYCEHHARRAYEPPKPSARRRAEAARAAAQKVPSFKEYEDA